MQLLEIFRQFNWVDIFFVILLSRVCYVAVKNGFLAELFRLLGVLSAIYFSFHYYINLSGFIDNAVDTKNLPLSYLSFFCFLFLVFFGYLIFALLGRLFSRFFKAEAIPRLNRWGSLILGVIRGFLLMSLIIFIFIVGPVGYFKDSISHSYTARRVMGAAPAAYAWLWNSIVSKFRPQEKFNDTISEVQKEYAG